MYADTELLHPYFQSFGQEGHHPDLCRSPSSYSSIGNLIETSLSEYDLGDGDLFNTSSSFMHEFVPGLGSMTTAISLISCGDDAVSSEELKVDIQAIDSDELLHEVFGKLEKDVVAKSSEESMDEKILERKCSEILAPKQIMEGSSLPESVVQKSVSMESLSSMEWMSSVGMQPSFLDFRGMDFGYGMRRAFSEGDIKTLSSGNTNIVHSPVEKWHYNSEERREKLSRYRCKKTKRNFDRKIKYACRKALADSQPRIRGRFAKAEDSDNSRVQ